MLEIRLLGQFSLRLHGAEVALLSRPAQALLAYLLLNANVAHRRERLAGLLWPDSNEASARRNLRQALWQIRRALAEAADTYLLADDLTMAFNQETAYWLDSALIAHNGDDCTKGDDWIKIVSAYGGELLPGFYDDWIVLERERLQAQFERKMHLLLDRLTAEARWPDVLHWGERWIALGHTPEPAYRALMNAHAALGDTSSVAEIYRRCVEALERDLGVEPSAQTRSLYERLRVGVGVLVAPAAHASPPTSSPRHNLPVQFSTFIGREREIAELHRRLAESHLVTLTGPGGTGKTRLALECATRIGTHKTTPLPPALHFPDGLWLVELAQLADADLIAQSIAAVLGVREEPNHPLFQSVLEHLREQRLLLILDNCEHLIDSCAQLVTALLRTCPQVKILATSRETLGMTGETVFRVPSLSLPDVRNLPAPEQLTDYEAIQLFVDRATTVKLDFQLTANNAAAIAQICHQLDGVPLAIELAAARIRTMTAEQIAARLDDRFRLLTGGSRTALPRQQTLRAMIDWSWDLLTEAERTLLRRLAVFWDGWTLDAAEAVCTDENGTIPQYDVLELLTHLIEKSLVLVEEKQGEARYYLLVTIRQYASEKLLDSGEAATVRSRHLTFFRHWAEKAEPELRAADQVMWLARLEHEHDNLRAALKWATASDALEAGLCLASNLGRFWYLRGYWKEGREWLQQFLTSGSVSAASPPPLLNARARALGAAGWLANDDGSEVALYTESLALSRQIGDRWGEAFALRGLAPVTANWNSSDQIYRNLHESRTIFQEIGNPWGVGLVHFNLGWLLLGDERHAEAEQSWQTSLARFREAGDCWGTAVALSALGYIMRLYGQYAKATELTHESLECFRTLGDKAGIALTITRLGNLALRRGDYAQAIALLQESLNLERERGDQEGVITALQLQGLVTAYQGDYARAVNLLEESLSLSRKYGKTYESGYTLAYLGFVTYLQNELDQAPAYLQESLLIFRDIQERLGIGFPTHVVGMVALRQNDLTIAHTHLQHSLALSQSSGDKRYIATDLDGLGQLALALADRGAALGYFQEALLLRKKMGDKQGVAETLGHLAFCAAQDQVAIHLLSAAHTLRQTLGAPVPPVEQRQYEHLVSTLRTRTSAFQRWWEEGRLLSLEQALNIAFSLGEN